MRKALVLGAGLIALYLVVLNSTGAGRVLAAGGTSGSTIIKTFQGR
jgi:hypothetical protein